MKKNKGFTIPELLAVIAILGILVTMATASYNGISNNIKKKTLDSKINLIKIKAEEYATDNDIVTDTISVAKLINEGYLDSEADTDNNERISNPLGGYLDCYRINIDKSTDEYDISVDEDTSCEIANMDNAADKIEISVYEGENNRITNYNPLNVTAKSSETKWTNKDAYLFINPDTIEGNVKKITWLFNGAEYPKDNVKMATTVNTDTDTYANIFKVSSVLLLNTYTYAKIETDEGVLSKRVSVKIDKEAPTVTLDTNYRYEAVDDETKKSLKTVNFTGSDGSGSGIGYEVDGNKYGYYLTKDINKRPNKDDFNILAADNFTTINENGTYYGYAIDGVGNISKEPVAITVTNVTYDMPVCLDPVDNDTWINHDYTFTYGCVAGVGTGCSYSPKTGTYSNEGYQMKEAFTWDAIDNVGNVTKCSKKLVTKIDKTAPSCEITVSGTKGNNDWYLSDVSLTLKCSDSLSGMAGIGLSTSDSPDFNGETTATVTEETNGLTYYGYAKDNAGNITKISKVIKIVKTPPTCTLAVSGPNNGVGDVACSLDQNVYDTCMANSKNGWFIFDKKTKCRNQAITCVKTNVWYTGDATVTMNTSGSFITSKILKTPSGNSSNGVYTVNYDTNGVEITGTVTNEAGLSSECSVKLRRDATPPTASLAMDGGDTCTYTVKYKTRTKKVNPNTNRVTYSTQSHTTTINCSDWDKNGYSNSTKLNNYLKTLSSDFYSRTSTTGPTWAPPLSTENARLKCSDSGSGTSTYTIDGTSGELYNLNSTSSSSSISSSGSSSSGFRPGTSSSLPWNTRPGSSNSGTSTANPTKTLTGVCKDVAGNTTSVSQIFEKYESERTEKDCDNYFSKSDCSGGSNKCAHKNGSCSKGDEDSCDWDDCSEGSKECDKADSKRDCDTYTVGENKWRVK